MLTKNPPWLSILIPIILSVLLLFLLPNNSFAQRSSSIKHASSIAWQLDATIDGVQFYHSIADCNGKKVVLLKFNNTNSYKVQASWSDVFTTQEGSNIKGHNGRKKLVLVQGATVGADCNDPLQKQLIILPHEVNPTYIADISKYGYDAIAIEKMQ